jgi:hypothetical protein
MGSAAAAELSAREWSIERLVNDVSDESVLFFGVVMDKPPAVPRTVKFGFGVNVELKKLLRL